MSSGFGLFQYSGGVVGNLTYRFSTNFDYVFCRVLLLDTGKIAEFDAPDALLSRKGVFYSMARDAGLA